MNDPLVEEDPIVAEVHRIREELWELCGCDGRIYSDHMRRFGVELSKKPFTPENVFAAAEKATSETKALVAALASKK